MSYLLQVSPSSQDIDLRCLSAHAMGHLLGQDRKKAHDNGDSLFIHSTQDPVNVHTSPNKVMSYNGKDPEYPTNTLPQLNLPHPSPQNKTRPGKEVRPNHQESEGNKHWFDPHAKGYPLTKNVIF